MPSRYEGLPQVAVQAVTAYVPVVGYAVGGLAELLPEEFTATRGDEERLATIVSSIAQEPRHWPARELALHELGHLVRSGLCRRPASCQLMRTRRVLPRPRPAQRWRHHSLSHW